MHLFSFSLRVVLLSISFLSASLLTAAEPPLTMRDIARMRYQKMLPEKIVDKATQQGVAFPMTPANEKQLARLGFTAEQIAAIKEASAPRSKEEQADAGKPIVPGESLRSTDAQRDEMLAKIKRMNKASGAELIPAEARHTTLWAAKDDLPVYLPDVKKLEKFLETKFKDPLRSGLDKRAAHLVLVKRHYEYERWMTAMFEIIGDPFKNVDAPGGTEELKKALLKGAGYCTEEFSIYCLEDGQPEWVHRIVAVDMGYMVFTQLTQSRHESLATGFANGLESFLAGSPAVMLFSNSYGNIDRDLGKDPRAWLHLVQQRITHRQVSSVSELVKMDTTNMTLPHYAEACTLVGVLAKQPAKFAELVLALREEKEPLKAIERIYGWDEKKLTEEWHKQVLAAR